MPGAQGISLLLYTHATIFFLTMTQWRACVSPSAPYGTIGMEYLVVQSQRHASRCWRPVVSASRIVQIDGLVQFPPSGRHLPRVRRLVGHGEGKGDEKGLLQRTNGRTQRSSGRFVGKLFSLGMPECYPTRAVRPVRDFFFSFFCGTAAPQGNIAVCFWPSITTSLALSPRH